MLKEKKLPQALWGEVIATTIYVLNKCPIKKLKETIPFEKWTGDKQSVSHFRVFGYVSYKHVTRKKMDDRRKVMFLIGYHNTSMYKLYCPITNKVKVSINVIVKESKAWDLSKSQSNTGVVLTPQLTFEDTSKFEGSEDESKSEDDFDGDFEDESDSECESDLDLDFDEDPDSGGQDFIGGQTSEGGVTYGGGQAFDIVQAFEEDSEQVQRPQIIIQMPMRFAEFDML